MEDHHFQFVALPVQPVLSSQSALAPVLGLLHIQGIPVIARDQAFAMDALVTPWDQFFLIYAFLMLQLLPNLLTRARV